MLGGAPMRIVLIIVSQCSSRVWTASLIDVEKVDCVTEREGSISAKRVDMKICASYDGRSTTANGEVMKFAMVMEDCKYVLSHGISPYLFCP